MYPINSPYKSSRLDVGNGHSLYIAEYGNPDGFPVVYLHGGPGGGNNPAWQAGFDPTYYRIILYDQRGCGQSTPSGSLEGNTIENLIEDVDRVRKYLKIKKWTIGGGSWGSALAMFYARRYPATVSNLILRGTFFATKDGAAHIAEEGGAVPKDKKYFDAYRDLIPEDVRHRNGLIKSYDHIMKTGDYAAQCEAAKRFMQWDVSIAFYDLMDALPHISEMEKHPEGQIPITKIYMHYALNEFDNKFRADLLNVPFFHSIPIDIIHGADDRICPIENSYQMAAAYPHAALHIVDGAGHSGMDKGMQEATIKASEKFKRINN